MPNAQLRNPTPNATEELWSYDWAEAIRYLARLPVPPKYVLLNAGLWPHDLGNATVRESIVDALRETGLIGIYKTTTVNRNMDFVPYTKHVHDWEMCPLLQRCMNVSWTGPLKGSQHYIDPVHFRAHVNQQFNEQLLGILAELEGKV